MVTLPQKQLPVADPSRNSPSLPHCSMLKLAFSLQPVLLFRAVCASSRKIEFIRTLGNLFSTRPFGRSVPVGSKDVANHFSGGFLGSFLSHARLLSDGHYLRPTTRITVLHFQTLLAAGGARFDVAYLVEMCAGWLGHNGSPFSSLLEVLMHELDGHGALTDGRGDALD